MLSLSRSGSLYHVLWSTQCTRALENPYIHISAHMSMAFESNFHRRYRMENSFYDISVGFFSFSETAKRIILLLRLCQPSSTNPQKTIAMATMAAGSQVNLPACISSVHMIYSSFCRQKPFHFQERATNFNNPTV